VKKPLTHTVWTWDEDLQYSTTYYWRVRAVVGTVTSGWTEASFTTMAKPVPPQPPIVIPPANPPPIINIPPAPAPVYTTPAYLWAVIIIGAILVIAVIVLIVRTRRGP